MRSDLNFTVTFWFQGNVPVKPYFNTQWGGHMHHYPCSYHLAWQTFVWENLADKWCSKRRRRCLFSGWLLRLFCEEYVCTLCQITKVMQFLKKQNCPTSIFIFFMRKWYGLFWIITSKDILLTSLLIVFLATDPQKININL